MSLYMLIKSFFRFWKLWREGSDALGILIVIDGMLNCANQSTRLQLLGTSDGPRVYLPLPSQFVNGTFDSIYPDDR